MTSMGTPTRSALSRWLLMPLGEQKAVSEEQPNHGHSQSSLLPEDGNFGVHNQALDVPSRLQFVSVQKPLLLRSLLNKEMLFMLRKVLKVIWELVNVPLVTL